MFRTKFFSQPHNLIERAEAALGEARALRRGDSVTAEAVQKALKAMRLATPDPDTKLFHHARLIRVRQEASREFILPRLRDLSKQVGRGERKAPYRKDLIDASCPLRGAIKRAQMRDREDFDELDAIFTRAADELERLVERIEDAGPSASVSRTELLERVENDSRVEAIKRAYDLDKARFEDHLGRVDQALACVPPDLKAAREGLAVLESRFGSEQRVDAVRRRVWRVMNERAADIVAEGNIPRLEAFLVQIPYELAKSEDLTGVTDAYHVLFEEYAAQAQAYADQGDVELALNRLNAIHESYLVHQPHIVQLHEAARAWNEGRQARLAGRRQEAEQKLSLARRQFGDNPALLEELESLGQLPPSQPPGIKAAHGMDQRAGIYRFKATLKKEGRTIASIYVTTNPAAVIGRAQQENGPIERCYDVDFPLPDIEALVAELVMLPREFARDGSPGRLHLFPRNSKDLVRSGKEQEPIDAKLNKMPGGDLSLGWELQNGYVINVGRGWELSYRQIQLPDGSYRGMLLGRKSAEFRVLVVDRYKGHPVMLGGKPQPALGFQPECETSFIEIPELPPAWFSLCLDKGTGQILLTRDAQSVLLTKVANEPRRPLLDSKALGLNVPVLLWADTKQADGTSARQEIGELVVQVY